MTKKPLVLVILDGWGARGDAPDNAIALADARHFHAMCSEYPKVDLECSGLFVGLPEGQMGNSEVGHLNMGAGRIVYQDITRIDKSIKDGDFFTNPQFQKAIDHAVRNQRSLHLMGLLSDGGVHSHIDHIRALLDLAKASGLDRVFVHAFLDGRDVPPQSARQYIDQLENIMREKGSGAIASLGGRYWGMDRDGRWDRVEKAYNLMTVGKGPEARSALEVIEQAYALGITDEFVEHTAIVGTDGTPLALIESGDSVIFFNFRADRARQITRAFVDPGFTGFERITCPQVEFVSMTSYDASLPVAVAFPPQNLHNTLGEYLAEQGCRQLRIAETEKYAHLTFFFNGGIEEPNPGEDRILIPSPKVATYDLKPEMSARQITERALGEIEKGIYDIIMINFANPDMVGHTGVLEAAVEAVKVVDDCVADIVANVLERGGSVVITADHGNVEQMSDMERCCAHTAHTTNKVPFILVSEAYQGRQLKEGGALQDVAPTLLQLLGLASPPEMTGTSLIVD